MNRQIEFRGKRLDNGEWVYGYYVENKLGNHFIYEIERNGEFVWNSYEVDPSTVGQFTGLVDKNGKRIYEGDFIQSNKSKYNRFNKDGIYEVYFNEFLCHFALVDSSVEWHKKHGAYDDYSLTGAKTKDFEVIGTIYDKENIE